MRSLSSFLRKKIDRYLVAAGIVAEAVALPNGAIVSIATALASALTVTAASNASECVLTVGNSLSAGDYVVFVSGWAKANNRVFRVKSPTGTNLVLEGFDTSNTTLFPASSGTGTIQKVNTWQQIQQVVDFTSSGGEPQYLTYSFLEQDYDTQIPTTTSAQSIAFSIADDPTLAGYAAVKSAAQTRSATALKVNMPQGGVVLYNGIFAFDETPSMTKGQLMVCKGGIALQNRPVRYST